MTEATITSVESRPLRIPLPAPIASALGTYTHVDGIVVFLHTSAGVTGHGYSLCLGGAAGAAMARYVADELGPLSIGRDASEPAALWRALWGPNKARLLGGIGAWALSAVDVACWDAAGRLAGTPIHAMLGQSPARVDVYGSGGWHTLDDAGLVAECSSFVEQGIEAYKLKIGTPRDRERLALLRRELGDELVLLADANQGYTVREAIDVSAMLADHGVAWLEEPVVAAAFRELRNVADRGSTPIAAGENVYFRWGFAELIDAGVAYLQPDVGRCGGITEFAEIASMAAEADVALTSHLWHEVSISLVGPASTGGRVEYAPLIPADALTRDFSVVGGSIEVPNVPGHGVELTADALARFSV